MLPICFDDQCRGIAGNDSCAAHGLDSYGADRSGWADQAIPGLFIRFNAVRDFFQHCSASCLFASDKHRLGRIDCAGGDKRLALYEDQRASVHDFDRCFALLCDCDQMPAGYLSTWGIVI